MTETAHQSRWGKLALVFALLAALTVVGFWANSAKAALPLTNTSLTQSPAGPGTVAPGTQVTYTYQAVLTADDGTVLTMEMTIDPDLANVVLTCAPASPYDGYTQQNPQEQNCHWHGAPIAAGTYTMTVTGDVMGQVSAPTGIRVCNDTDDDGNCADQSGNDLKSGADTTSGVGTLSMQGVSVSPDATNVVGVAHTFTWTLPAGFTCESDNNNDGNVDCTSADVTVADGGTGATAAAPVVNDADMADTSAVSVTITGATAGAATVTLATKFGDTGDGDIDTPNVSAVKTYADAFGILRHWDIDEASEDAAGNEDGILDDIRDDPDDATGSTHRVCIVDTNLTHADNAAQITWSIINAAGSSATVVPGPGAGNAGPTGGNEIEGPNGEPCVEWRSGGTGGQNILASFEAAPGVPGITIGYSGFGFDDPAIKQWNSIDSTKIVNVTGTVGDTLGDNTVELDNWTSSPTDECTRQAFTSNTFPAIPVPDTCLNRANLDGTTVVVGGTIFTPDGDLFASGRSFIDYTLGSHTNFDGPIDGAQQTYTVSGNCGSVRLEDPVTGNVIILFPGQSATVLSSNYGVGFQVLPNDNGDPSTDFFNANCQPGSTTTVTITTREEVQLRSDLDTAPTEVITVQWVSGPPTNKQPLLAWAGQRVVLEWNWRLPDGTCPVPQQIGNGSEYPQGSATEGDFYVRYVKHNGPGAIVDDLENGVAFGPDFMTVGVFDDRYVPRNEDGTINRFAANSDCISRVIYESQDEGEVDVTANIVLYEGGDIVMSQQVSFVVFYMKLEDVTLGLVPGSREFHNSGQFNPANPHGQTGDTDTPSVPVDGDVTSLEDVNVSADTLARVRVRGWVQASNCPVRPAGADSNGGLLPANRCIFPDDWRHMAGGDLAEELRPNMDIMTAPNRSGLECDDDETSGRLEIGPFSLLDPAINDIDDVPSCSDSKAPNVLGGFFLDDPYREVVLPDGVVDMWDAPMPPSLVRFALDGSGFLRAADKADVYPNNVNRFYKTHIPAEPWISQFNFDGSGYRWNSWGIPGNPKTGPYYFWTGTVPGDLPETPADAGPEVISESLTGDVPTGGYKTLRVYSDNHGEAMVWVNGDADLDFRGCISGPGPNAAHNIVSLVGFFCRPGDVVGDATLVAAADYPDKRKHFPLASNEVDLEFTFGGEKGVQIVPGEHPQFNFVVFHVTDRDGFCADSPSLHPVLGERVLFEIDSPTGIIEADAQHMATSDGEVVTANGKIADLRTFSALDATAAELPPELEAIFGDEDVCLAWVHISESLLQPVNVKITAFDPEGTVTFDVIINPVVPPVRTLVFGDADCDGDVDAVDSLKVLRRVADLEVLQTEPCPDLGSVVSVDGTDMLWGDVDGDGDVDAVDALKILRHVADLSVDQEPGTPAIGDDVEIPA